VHEDVWGDFAQQISFDLGNPLYASRKCKRYSRFSVSGNLIILCSLKFRHSETCIKKFNIAPINLTNRICVTSDLQDSVILSIKLSVII